jgi:hypothetical protein
VGQVGFHRWLPESGSLIERHWRVDPTWAVETVAKQVDLIGECVWQWLGARFGRPCDELDAWWWWRWDLTRSSGCHWILMSMRSGKR